MQLESESIRPVVMRMKRAHGHLAKVISMLEEGSECEDVVTQLAAVNKALAKAGYAIVATGMQQCIASGDQLDRDKMEKLFLTLA